MSQPIPMPRTARAPGFFRVFALLSLVFMLLWQLRLPMPVGAAAVTAVAFGGGTGTASVGGVLYAKTGADLTLSVVTDANTKCVDVTGAYVAYQASPSNQTNWTFNFTADAGSGVRTVTVTAYKKAHPSQPRCIADAGEVFAPATASYTLNNTGPVVTGVVSPAANGAGWHNTDTTVTWSASGGAGLASGPTPASETQTANTSGATMTATATDLLGNVGNGAVTVKLDKDAPTIGSSTSPSANANGWYNTDVTVNFTCADVGPSGIDGCTAGATLTNEGAGQSAAGTATDVAGNSASTTVSGINIDKTAPTLSGAPAAGPNGTNGWYTSDVAIVWTCGDTLSGLDGGCPANSTISGEGSGLTASATVSDKAGNTASASSPAVMIDKTAPNTGHNAPNGWNSASVTVVLTPADALSGVAATRYTLDGGPQQTGTSVTITGDGDHTLTFWSVDNAGNVEAAQTIQVEIDSTAPTINHTQAPPANGNGWNNSTVTVTFTCDDPLSGIASCTSPQTVTSEGQGQPVTGTATNNAGQSTTDPATVSIDKTAPTISGSQSPSANGNGWSNTDVTVTFTCADALSGIDTCAAPQTLGEGAGQAASGTAIDAAGNSASVTVSGINVDKTAPSLSGAATTAPNGNGWYNGNVVVTWTCSDALSGLDGSCPVASTITGEGDNLSASATVCDLAGNCATATVSGIKIDRTAPNTTASVPAAPASGKHANSVNVALVAADGLSGIGATYYALDGGAQQTYTGPIAISGSGAHTLSFWSVDNAGNAEDASAAGHQITLTVDNNIITFAPLSNKTFGAAPFSVSASASSNLPVSFTAAGNCSVAGNVVTLTGVGSCTITASQAGDATHNPASPVARTFAITSAPVQNVLLTLPSAAGGTVSRDLPGTGSGPYAYPVGTLVTLTPQPAAGQTFTGWTVDGAYAGWANPMDITMDADHTVVATFAPTKAFADVAAGDPYRTAITELASRGTINGYNAQQYGPANGVLRAQMAALIARAMGWGQEDWGNPFTDQGGLDAGLWRNVGTLHHYGVALGYTANDCAAKGRANPCFGPNDPVTYAQTISFVTRAMVAKGYWQQQPGASTPYAGVPAAHAADVATYHFYTGGIVDAPSNASAWNGPATRGWFAQTLWRALDSYWGLDDQLPNGSDAGGFVP